MERDKPVYAYIPSQWTQTVVLGRQERSGRREERSVGKKQRTFVVLSTTEIFF